MAKNKLAKSQRVSVSKRKLGETADAMEQVAVVTAVAGEMEVLEGAEKLDEAANMAATGAVLMGKGASDLTRAEDEKLMAGRMAVLSEVVGAAGVMAMLSSAGVSARVMPGMNTALSSKARLAYSACEIRRCCPTRRLDSDLCCVLMTTPPLHVINTDRRLTPHRSDVAPGCDGLEIHITYSNTRQRIAQARDNFAVTHPHT